MNPWYLQNREWCFLKDKIVVLNKICNMDEADKVGMELYKMGQCDSWTIKENT